MADHDQIAVVVPLTLSTKLGSQVPEKLLAPNFQSTRLDPADLFYFGDAYRLATDVYGRLTPNLVKPRRFAKATILDRAFKLIAVLGMSMTSHSGGLGLFIESPKKFLTTLRGSRLDVVFQSHELEVEPVVILEYFLSKNEVDWTDVYQTETWVAVARMLVQQQLLVENRVDRALLFPGVPLDGESVVSHQSTAPPVELSPRWSFYGGSSVKNRLEIVARLLRALAFTAADCGDQAIGLTLLLDSQTQPCDAFFYAPTELLAGLPPIFECDPVSRTVILTR